MHESYYEPNDDDLRSYADDVLQEKNVSRKPSAEQIFLLMVILSCLVALAFIIL